MDLQQILALAVVAAAVVFIAGRMIRRRRKGKFKECADCIHLGEHQGPGAGGKR